MKQQKKHYYALDAFRGIAALLVLLYHMPNLSALTNNKFISNSAVFVDLFFVLSGFVIYHNYKDKIPTFKKGLVFLKRRLLRLYPLHLFTLIVLLVLEISKYFLRSNIQLQTAPFEGNTIPDFFLQLFLLNATPLFSGFNWNGQSWSISAEIIAYISFIFLSIYLFKTLKKTLITCVIVVLSCYLFFFIKYNTFNILIDFKYAFIRAFSGFFTGVVVYIIHLKLKPFKHLIVSHIAEALAVFLLVLGIINLYKIIDFFFIINLLFALLIFVFSFESGFLSRFLSHKIFQKIGLWSYSIYLNHAFTINIFKKITINIWKVDTNSYTFIALEIVFIIITIFYSYLTYHFIEKRFYNRLRQKTLNS